MGLTDMTYDRSLLRKFDSHWVKDGYNLGILSSYVTKQPNITKIIQLISMNIWSFILISTLVITLFNAFYGGFS